MNDITIPAEMTLQEYTACQDALRYSKGVRTVLWAVLAVGAACLASSAALTWGTPASILAGLALAAFFFTLYLVGRINATQGRKAYKRYRESNPSYTFTSERILATSRYVQSSIAWSAVDRVMETTKAYLLIVGLSCVCVPKRNIPPQNLDDFIQLLRTHHLLGQP